MKSLTAPLAIQIDKMSLLNGPVLRFFPKSFPYLGDRSQITLLHICYRARTYRGAGDAKGYRVSFTRLQEQLPFMTRRTLIKIIKDLEAQGLLHIERKKRLNFYVPPVEFVEVFGGGKSAALKESGPAPYIVAPKLAEAIGLKGALLLQQIHVRCCNSDGSVFALHSLNEWRSQVFPCWGAATVSRAFRTLRECNLIITEKYTRETEGEGTIQTYRVNYQSLAALLGVPVPEAENPFAKGVADWKSWINPVTLVKQNALDPIAA